MFTADICILFTIEPENLWNRERTFRLKINVKKPNEHKAHQLYTVNRPISLI